ncbi:hypothetical protein [Streptomyces sp. NPDC001410]|uniref:hypothetical protein n=1 Tax=Streptomyces sp. NPDC001410 TaxID=3364574 RepID=UPI0036B72997
MSRLAGVPLRGTALGKKELEALVEAVAVLYEAVPPDVVRQVPLRPGRPSELVGHIGRWAVDMRPQTGGLVRRAMDVGLSWLARSGLEADTSRGPEVFGPGDGNLANYLWDGSRVRVVDFEDSGRSDRAFGARCGVNGRRKGRREARLVHPSRFVKVNSVIPGG